MGRNFGTSWPLAVVFGLCCHWVGEALRFIFSAYLGENSGWTLPTLYQLLSNVSRFFHRDFYMMQGSQVFINIDSGFMYWWWGAGSVILDPFFSLFTLFASALVFAVAGKILLPVPAQSTSPGNFRTMLTIAAYAMAPSIFLAIPLGGPAFSRIYGFFLTIVGIKTLYHTNWWRAVLVICFPWLIILTFGLFCALAVIALLFKIFGSFPSF